MGDAAGRGRRLHVESTLELLLVVPQTFATPEEYRHDRDVHVVDQIGGKELADSRRATANSHVQSGGSLPGGFQCFGWFRIEEMERCAPFQLDRRSRVMGEYEDGGLKDRVVAPLTLPCFIHPWTPLWPELVAAHDLGTDPLTPPACERIIEADSPSGLSVHLAKRPSRQEPFHEFPSGMAKGRVQTLSLASSETIEGYREVVYTNS